MPGAKSIIRTIARSPSRSGTERSVRRKRPIKSEDVVQRREPHRCPRVSPICPDERMAEFDRVFGYDLGKPRCRNVAGLTASTSQTSKSPARRARRNALLASPQRGGVRCAPVPSRRPARKASRVRTRGQASARPLAEPAEARVRSSDAALLRPRMRTHPTKRGGSHSLRPSIVQIIA